MRMYQRLMEDPFILPPIPDGRPFNATMAQVEEFTRSTRDLLHDAVVIECSNVADYFKKHYLGDDESGIMGPEFFEDLRAICPPYRTVFYEWGNLPAFMGKDVKRIGLLVEGATATEAPLYLGEEMRDSVHKLIAEHDPKWVMVAHIFIEAREEWQGSALRGPYATQIYAADNEGNHIASIITMTPELNDSDGRKLNTASLVGMLAQSMINCKNIITRTNHVPKKLNKARKKRNKKPLIDFKTIHVDPNTKIAAQAATSNTTGESRARGPRRGHLKDYRKGKGLFGRHKGLFYFGPQLSGDASKGICLPDYTIDAKE